MRPWPKYKQVYTLTHHKQAHSTNKNLNSRCIFLKHKGLRLLLVECGQFTTNKCGCQMRSRKVCRYMGIELRKSASWFNIGVGYFH